MKSKYLAVWLPSFVILAMLASLVTPAPVLAAGEPPPPPGEKSPKSAPAVTKPAPPSSDASYSAEAPLAAPDGAAFAAPVALSVDALAQAGAVLVGADGSILPLAAQDTVNVLLSGDAYFKGSGVLCAAGFCHFPSIAAALANFFTCNGTGTIYANGVLSESGAVNVINPPSLNLSKLTGLAWDGTTNYNPKLTGGTLTIANMLKGFTVDGFYIGHGIIAHDNAGTLRLQNLSVTNPGGFGIYVYDHKGNIDLFNVSVYGAGGDGAALDNCNINPITHKCDNTGNVTIGNSSFNGNTWYGLSLKTSGSALIDRVEASDNLGYDGANLTSVKGVTVKDSRFDRNHYNGLSIYGQGTTTLQNVAAQGNLNDGVYIDVANDIKIDGTTMTGNTGDGLQAISSGGNITLNNVLTQDNSLGVVLSNYSLTGPVKTVTVTNSRFIYTTGDSGLIVNSKGSVTLNHIEASNNSDDGVFVDNAQWDAASSKYKGSGSVSILSTLGLNRFFSNGKYGFAVKSMGAITVKGASALSNLYGLMIDGCLAALNPLGLCLGKGNVTLSGLQVETSANNALDVRAGGSISLDSIRSDFNMWGVYLENNLAPTPKPVTVTKSSFNNGTWSGVGLQVQSKGNITLNNVQANTNVGKLTYGPLSADVSGIFLNNCIYVGGACTGSGSVSVLSSLGPSQAMNNSQGLGLLIHSHGAVSVSGFSSISNSAGAIINDQLGRGAGAVTISNSTFNGSTGGLFGLRVNSNKAVTLSGVQAFDNLGAGAVINNNPGILAGTDPVTISKSHFDYNSSNGLNINGKGNVTLNNVSAQINYNGYGAYIKSAYGGVTISDSLGPNDFSFNHFYGLDVANVPGAISVSGVSATYNSLGFGISLDNYGSSTFKPVTVQKILVENNGGNGLYVVSKGSVKLNGVQANFNPSGYGVYIDNCGLPAPCAGSGNVTILSTLGLNSMNSNKYGLWIETAGTVLVNGVTSSNNTGALNNTSGVMIETNSALGKTVTVNRSNFNYNHAAGLRVNAWGLITLNNIAASYNLGGQGYGAFLVNSWPGVTAGINILSTLGNNQFSWNALNGMVVSSSGNITLSKVTASDNSGVGASLFTQGTSLITITCSAFNHNSQIGLFLSLGTGNVVLKSVAATGNAGLVQDITQVGGTARVISWTVCGH